MSVKAWQPSTSNSETETAFTIDSSVLRQFIQLCENDQLNDLCRHMPQSLQTSQAPLMTAGRETWSQAAADLSNEEIIHLIRFFTLAEQQLDGWQAGADSPVIWLVKVLRQRKAAPDKELLLWIKANSDNRFLPNGAL